VLDVDAAIAELAVRALAACRQATVLRAQPPERLEAIRTAIVDGVRRYPDGDAFALPLAARVVVAATDDKAPASRS
jgi:hypothetical protein